MLKTKTALLSGVLMALAAHPAGAVQFPAAQLGQQQQQCEKDGGHMGANGCEMPAQRPAQQTAPTPDQRRGAPEGNQGAQRGDRAGTQAGQQGAVQPNNAQQEPGRSGRGQTVVPRDNVQQGRVQQGDAQRGGRGGAQQGGLQEGNVQQDNRQQDRGRQGNDRHNNFGPRDNGQYGNTGQYGNNNGQYGNNNGQYGYNNGQYGYSNGQYGNNNGQYGNNNGQYGNSNTFGQRNYGQYGNFGNNGQYGNNYGPYGSNSGRNFDQNAFNQRYYGRYGYDPNNFQRNRQLYRVQQRWQERYPHDYVYADDSFYRDCRSNNEVGGAVVGAILGGILGSAVSHGQGGATLAGVILGGVGGASLAGNLDCEDRSYVYPAYYDGFERGRSRASYRWRNDRNGDYGTLLVGDYYQDRDNYRCATYTQTIYVRGTPQVGRGHACRQDDGTWALVD